MREDETLGNHYASVRTQMTISANMIVSIFVMFAIGYMAGKSFSENESTVVFIDHVLILCWCVCNFFFLSFFFQLYSANDMWTLCLHFHHDNRNGAFHRSRCTVRKCL